MRTPDGILTNNPLGYELFNNYIKPVLSKPDFTTIRSIFQDNDLGESGYIADYEADINTVLPREDLTLEGIFNN